MPSFPGQWAATRRFREELRTGLLIGERSHVTVEVKYAFTLPPRRLRGASHKNLNYPNPSWLLVVDWHKVIAQLLHTNGGTLRLWRQRQGRSVGPLSKFPPKNLAGRRIHGNICGVSLFTTLYPLFFVLSKTHFTSQRLDDSKCPNRVAISAKIRNRMRVWRYDDVLDVKLSGQLPVARNNI